MTATDKQRLPYVPYQAAWGPCHCTLRDESCHGAVEVMDFFESEDGEEVFIYGCVEHSWQSSAKAVPTHEFRRKLETLIEEERAKATGTPDFILAAYLQKCLERFPQEGVSGQEVIDNWTRIFGEPPL